MNKTNLFHGMWQISIEADASGFFSSSFAGLNVPDFLISNLVTFRFRLMNLRI
jgi:hypothetical protein